MSYVTGILLVTTLTAIGQTRNATIRNSNQFETAIGAFVCFNLHQWSLVYLLFFLACWKRPHVGCQKTAFNLIDNTSTGLEQRSSDAKPMAIAWIRDEFLILSDFLHLVNSMLPFRDFQQRTSEGRDWLTNNQGFAALTSVRLVKWLETMTRAVTRSKAVEVTATFFVCFGRCLGCKNGTKLLQNPTTSAGSEGFGNCTLILQWDWKNYIYKQSNLCLNLLEFQAICVFFMMVQSSGGLQTRSDRGSQPLVARLSVTFRLLDAA